MLTTLEPTGPGPERPTVAESLVGLFRLPYLLGCLALTAIIGFPGGIIVAFLDTRDLMRAFAFSISTGGFVTVPVDSEPTPQAVARTMLFNVFLLAALYSMRYYRTRIVDAEPKLALLVPKGERGFHEAFGRVSSPKWAYPIASLFFVAYTLPRAAFSIGPYTLSFALIAGGLSGFLLASGFSVYLNALWGLRKFGNMDIQLKPYYKDAMLGLRPLGAICVSLGMAFIGLYTIALLGSALAGDLANMAVIVAILSFSVIMLFLPLQGIHRKMVRQKQAEEATLRQSLEKIVSDRDDAEVSGAELRLGEISKIMKAHLEKDWVEKIPTWPFDTRLVQRLAAVTIAIITVVLARLAQLALRL